MQSLQSVFSRFFNLVRDVVGLREAAGMPLSLGDYRHLLRCARAIGSKTTAQAVWNGMLNAGVAPDGICYNHLLAATIWHDAYMPQTRHRLRVIPLNTTEPTEYSDRAPAPFKVGDGGIQEEIRRISMDMVQAELQADEETYTIVMLAAAREGKVDEIKSMLQRVWDIDLDDLMSGSSPLSLAQAQPLQASVTAPSVRLLFSALHCLAINNLLPVAIRVVDFISRTYSISIPRSVWSNIFEWTFVFTKPRWNGHAVKAGQILGRIDRKSLSNLWATIRSPPYNVPPTLSMYTRLIRILTDYRRWDAIIETIHEGHAFFETCSKVNGEAVRLFEEARAAGAPQYVLAPLERLARMADTRQQRNLTFVRRWIRMVLRRTNHFYAERVPPEEWLTREIPVLVRHFEQYVPDLLGYAVSGGRVEFHIRGEELSPPLSDRRDKKDEADTAAVDWSTEPITESEAENRIFQKVQQSVFADIPGGGSMHYATHDASGSKPQEDWIEANWMPTVFVEHTEPQNPNAAAGEVRPLQDNHGRTG